MLRSASDVLDDYVTWASGDDPRIQLGLPGLDEDFRGIAPGELGLLIGRSYVGKTNVLMNVIVARLDTPQLVVSLEMPGRALVARMLAIDYDIPYRDLEDGVRARDPQVMLAVEGARERFDSVSIVDDPNVSIDTLSELIEEDSPRFVTLDYLELLAGPDGRRDDPLQHVVATATGLKGLAKQHDVAILALHQVGREQGSAGWKPLSLTSARYGGETQADYVIGVYRPALDPDMDEGERHVRFSEVVVQVLKNRDGVLSEDKHYEMDRRTLCMEQVGSAHPGGDGSTGPVSAPRRGDIAMPTGATPAAAGRDASLGKADTGLLPGQLTIDDALARVQKEKVA